MLSRLFALLVLLVLIGGGLYYWQLGRAGLPAPESLGEIGERIQDVKTTGAVKGALALNRRLVPYAIDVEARQGTVTLRGALPSDDLRELAATVAGAVPDVERVDNALRVAGAAPPTDDSDRTMGESLDDQKLAVQVRLAFSLNRDLKGTDIEVDAFRREITLSGAVDRPEQRALAVKIAADVPDVGGVRDRIRQRGEEEPGPAERARRALGASPHLDAGAITVREDGGRLILSGRVRTGAERELAELLARDAGERPVDNRLEIRPD
jgi:hyperosmotically inducible periplasmic protein